jgi:hypothetical protein
MSTYTAWVCEDCEGDEPRILGTAYPATRSGLLKAILELTQFWEKYPRFEWGVYFDDATGAHYGLFYGSRDLVVETLTWLKAEV